ncbi:hypothetical protein BX616_007844 [Lobosporangium transversale]|uniref:RNase H type-1 domain-containing protein n=1 Tax=Lobosporangium transversale TaxID=64571 RepID=A0A1Y2GPV9_9FUNG|nr:hypothetical protein BCR41DRAFT_422762 [Lobosporangium transversale]KAF9914656.1 hypothetical protein BX616_007844 [Lobosporangium transversale]ORZ13869.1 hypothetical protein BCR41DRAFT_422762 [Lobosporangium transversale]|eukprot:XP_021880653.1 hypothetical protein BCR41DRAFT_422762 [Lobosporangium transversale]
MTTTYHSHCTPNRSVIGTFYSQILVLKDLQSLSTQDYPPWANRVITAEKQRRKEFGHTRPTKAEKSRILTIGETEDKIHDDFSTLSLSSLDNDTDLPGLIFDTETQKMIRAARQALRRRSGARCLYSDGSYSPHYSARARVSFGVTFLDEDGIYRPAVYGTVQDINDSRGPSSKAEIVGFLAAILCCPRYQPAAIFIDALSVVHGFVNHIQSNTIPSKPSRPNAEWWKLVQTAYAQQGRMVVAAWIPGHSGVEGNEAADKLATTSHSSRLLPWDLVNKDMSPELKICLLRALESINNTHFQLHKLVE